MGCKCVRQEQIEQDVNMDNLNDENNNNNNLIIKNMKYDDSYNDIDNNNNNNLIRNDILNCNCDIPNSKNSSFRNKFNQKNGTSYRKNSKNGEGSTNINSNKQENKIFSYYSGFSTEYIKNKVVYEINFARIHPQRLMPKIQKILPKIKQTNDRIYLNLYDKANIKLHLGNAAFQSCLTFLSTQKKLPKLIFKEELCLDFPDDNPSICDNESYLKDNITKKAFELEKSGIEMINFHYDIFYLEPELSVLMQVVDDTNSRYQRRKNIFNPDSQYLGVNFGKKKEGIFCFYITFARDLPMRNNK